MKLNPKRLEYAMNYANALEFCGHKEKCLEQLEYILDNNLLYTDAFRSWCLLNKNVNSSDIRVKRILKILKTNKVSIEQEIPIIFGILTVENHSQAKSRITNAVSYAENAVEMACNF